MPSGLCLSLGPVLIGLNSISVSTLLWCVLVAVRLEVVLCNVSRLLSLVYPGRVLLVHRLIYQSY